VPSVTTSTVSTTSENMMLSLDKSESDVDSSWQPITPFLGRVGRVSRGCRYRASLTVLDTFGYKRGSSGHLLLLVPCSCSETFPPVARLPLRRMASNRGKGFFALLSEGLLACLLAYLPCLCTEGCAVQWCPPSAIALRTPPFCVCRVVVRTRMHGPGAARPFRLKS
jgi:hypothetical protein